MFLIVCSIAAKSLSMDIEKIFNEFLILGIFFILIAVSVVIYGIFHFTEVDDIDIFAQLIQKSNLKSITSKL
jgi:high-affinity Fe2+/Pb2+ permease